MTGSIISASIRLGHGEIVEVDASDGKPYVSLTMRRTATLDTVQCRLDADELDELVNYLEAAAAMVGVATARVEDEPKRLAREGVAS